LPWRRPLSHRKKGVKIGNLYAQIHTVWLRVLKIGTVDPETALLKCLFQKNNASKTYSPRGRHAARAKNLIKTVLNLVNNLEKFSNEIRTFF